ncbi:uncharacterized protein LOC132753911, partial [Ruditapes philippinarum]|uniref:uncharacterized protein LOC132753911 n=1 Tax=Ruditapes philippinarum TaxID=129788 RepID=UPI00295B0AAF
MSDMQFLSFKNFFNVLILMYVIVDPPRVISRGKRGRIHQRDNSMRDKESIEVSDIHQFPSNSLEADEYGDLEADKYRDLHADELNNYSTNDKEVEKSRHKRIDPKGSWLTFVNRLGDSKPDRRKRKKKRKRKRNFEEATRRAQQMFADMMSENL